MKKMFMFCTLITLLSCCKNEQKPEEKILGKWELIEHRVAIDPDGRSTEFLLNGKIREYDNIGGYSEGYTYRIDHEFLYKNPINKEGDTWIFKYLFYDNKLKLEIVGGTVNVPDCADCGIYILKRFE